MRQQEIAVSLDQMQPDAHVADQHFGDGTLHGLAHFDADRFGMRPQDFEATDRRKPLVLPCV